MVQSEFLGFADVVQNSHVLEWKANGGKVVGFYCTDMPEQIVHAVGMLPFRMRGTGNSNYTLSDGILSRFNCTFVRSVLNLAMAGQYDFLDGLMVGNTCDHIRRMYDIFGKKLHFEPRFFLSFPHVYSDEGREWVRDELERVILQISESYGVEVSSAELQDAISVYRENARLMKQLDALRWQDEPRLSGADFLRLAVANSAVRKDYANEQLVTLLPLFAAEAPIARVRARLLVAGSFIDNPEFVKILEHAGGVIVADAVCLGTRSFRDEEPSDADRASPADPLDELVKICYDRSLCPRMMGGHARRLEYIQSRIREARVDGVILERIEFCDLHGCSNMLLQHALEDLGIPVLSLDREYFLGDTGRFKTRVEAFLEKIGG